LRSSSFYRLRNGERVKRMAMERVLEVSLRPQVRSAKRQESRMFPLSRSWHRFLLSTICLLFLISPAMAQEAKNVLVLYGNTAELP
jgi:hypothetical protein